MTVKSVYFFVTGDGRDTKTYIYDTLEKATAKARSSGALTVRELVDMCDAVEKFRPWKGPAGTDFTILKVLTGIDEGVKELFVLRRPGEKFGRLFGSHWASLYDIMKQKDVKTKDGRYFWAAWLGLTEAGLPADLRAHLASCRGLQLHWIEERVKNHLDFTIEKVIVNGG